MARSRSLDTIQRLAEYDAENASRAIGERLRALRAEEERLRQVQEFVAHYEKISVTGASGLTAGVMQVRRQFAARLRDAAESQSAVVQKQEAGYREQVESWRTARARALALQRFNERIRQREQDEKERREQARLDEIGLRRR